MEKDLYYISQLPGDKEGLSASCIRGGSLIINDNIDEEKKMASGKVIEFMLSKEMQLKYTKQMGKWSALHEIYNDETLCKQIDCNLIKNTQIITKPVILLHDYDEYSLKYSNIFMKYLNGNSTAKDSLDKIDDLQYILTIDHKSYTGISVTILTITLIIIILASYGLIFIKKFDFYIKMLNKKYWIILILGLGICLSINLFMLGDVTIFKCNAILVSTIIGISLIFYPFFITGLINLPESNNFTEFVRKHQLLAICILILIDVLSILLIIVFSSYQTEFKYVDNKNSFKYCYIKDKLTYVYLMVIVLLKLSLFLSVIFFVFMEWNSDLIFNDIKIMSLILYSVSIYVISILIISISNLKKYYFVFFVKIVLNILLSASIYFIIFWFRMYLELSNSKKKIHYKLRLVKDENKKEKLSNYSNENNTLNIIKVEDHHRMPENIHIHSINRNRVPNSRRNNVPEYMKHSNIMKSSLMTDIKEEITEENN